jgi:hypothetical protein
MEEVIEGRPPLPQVARPFIQGCSPAPEDNPTLVNNVETLANVAPILADGPDWLRATGTQLAPEQLDVPLDFDSMRQVGSGLGAAGFAVLDDPAWMVQAAWRSSRFLFVESCGQCPACKFGTGEVTQTLAAIQAGGGSDRDLELILVRARGSTSGQKCACRPGRACSCRAWSRVRRGVRQPPREVVSAAPRAPLPQARRLGRDRGTVRLRPDLRPEATRLDLTARRRRFTLGRATCSSVPHHAAAAHELLDARKSCLSQRAARRVISRSGLACHPIIYRKALDHPNDHPDIRERTSAGLAAARARGRHGGRPSVLAVDRMGDARGSTAPTAPAKRDRGAVHGAYVRRLPGRPRPRQRPISGHDPGPCMPWWSPLRLSGWW